ncbi:MAG: glycosyltransferase family 2 protein [Cyanobacteria bacterium J06627_28]
MLNNLTEVTSAVPLKALQKLSGKVRAKLRSQRQRLAEQSRLCALSSSVRHVHGPLSVTTAQTEAVVLCVVKDGESLAQAFIEHYLNLGFKHLYFLDNGSTDRTIEIIRCCQQATIISSDAPFQDYYITFKNFLIQSFGRGKWCLVADIDEFLFFPLHQTLPNVLSYLNQHRHSTVFIQMLDVFSRAGILLSHKENTLSLTQLRQVFCYYDLNALKKQRPARLFQPALPAGANFLYGGIRKTVFNQNCFLTKEALFFAGKHTKLKSSHLLNRSRVADFSGLFLHYKFTDNFYTSTLHAVQAENHWQDSKEYKAYLSVLEKQAALSPESTATESTATLSLFQPSSRRLNDIDSLIDQGFLFASERFSSYAAQTTPIDEQEHAST